MGEVADDDDRDFGTSVYLASVVTLAVAATRPPCSDLAGVPDPIYCMGGLGAHPLKPMLVFAGLWIALSIGLQAWRTRSRDRSAR